jgi:hypothetical protein
VNATSETVVKDGILGMVALLKKKQDGINHTQECIGHGRQPAG